MKVHSVIIEEGGERMGLYTAMARGGGNGVCYREDGRKGLLLVMIKQTSGLPIVFPIIVL